MSLLIPRWLSDTLVEARIDISTLGRPVGVIEEAFNRSVESFELPQLASQIFQDQLNGRVGFLTANESALSLGQDAILESISTSREGYYLELTQDGGKCWEQLAGTDWSRFTSVQQQEVEVNGIWHWQLAIEAETEELARRLSQNLDLLGYSQSKGEFQLSRLVPWEATYWKFLPSGVRLTCENPVDIGIVRTEGSEQFWDSLEWYNLGS